MKTDKSIRGWASGFACMLMVTLNVLPVSIFSLFMRPICAEIGASTAQFSLIFSLSSAGSMFTSLVFGKLCKHVNKKILIVLGALSTTVFLLTGALATSIYPMYIAVFISGFGASTCGFAMAQLTITQWFDKGRATMFSLITVVMQIVSATVAPMLATWINTYGYSQVLIVEAFVCGGGTLLLGLFLISNAPEKYGLKPIGYVESPAAVKQETVSSANSSYVPLKSAFKTPAFWMILAICFLASFNGRIEQSQSANFYQSLGLDSIQASYAVSVNSIAALVWSLLYGVMADRFSSKNAAIISGTIAAVVLLGNPMLAGMSGAMVYACCVEGESGIASTYAPAVATRMFGKAEAASMIGIVRFTAAVGSVVSPVFAGWMYDTFGNYKLCFMIAGIIMVLIVLFAILVESRKSIENVNQYKIQIQ